MTKVLILTKNSLAEQELQCSLQRMNDEVFCSSSLFFHAANCFEIIQHFTVVILSDTISTLELCSLLPQLVKTGSKIIRKGDKELVKKEENAWMLDAISDWIEEDTTMAEIVEMIAKLSVSENSSTQYESRYLFNLTNFNNRLNINFKKFISDLSINEKKVLYQLYNAEGENVSREELSHTLWNSSPTNSTLSQLSSIVNRLRVKIAEAGFEGTELYTNWGQGYQMGGIMYSYLRDNDFTVSV